MIRRQYWWIVTHDQGKPYLVFGGADEEESRRKGLEILGGMDFELKRYPTRDLDAASSFYRGKRLDETHSLHDAGARIGHDRSVARMIRNKRKKQQGGLG